MTFASVLLSEVAKEVTVGHVGPMASEYVEQGIPFLRSLNVEPFRINLDDVKFITEEFHGRLRKSALQPGDVVIVRTGKPGTCAVVPKRLEVANCSDLVVVRCGPRILPKYLAYWVNSLAAHHVGSNTVGAVQQHFNVGAAKQMPLLLPSLLDQEQILSVLARLDEKIDLNRRMNEALEAMAQAIFRDWFVDFGPVRRKLAGATDPVEIMGGVTADADRAEELARLFPPGLGDNELPTGWRLSTVDTAFNLTMGQSPPGETYNEEGEGLPFFQGRTDFGFRFPVRRKYCSQPKRLAQPDDTLISVRAPVGDLNMAWEKCCIGRGVAAARHKSGAASYTYYAMQALQPELEQFEHTGTVFGAINKQQFERLSVVEPGADLVSAFEVLANPMDARIRTAVDEANTLAETRDYILPRLMSGEVRVLGAAQGIAA